MKIVLGVDDSAHSQAALEYVRKTPWPTDTQVIVVSSVPLPVGLLSGLTPVTGMEVGVWLKELTTLHTQLVAASEKSLQSAGLATRGEVPQGDPRECLVEVAKKERADLVILGSHGRSGLGRLLLGSVASHVVAHSPCSVLVIKLKSEG
jgi:nucleotide-binding universal stress UspA family protein